MLCASYKSHLSLQRTRRVIFLPSPRYCSFCMDNDQGLHPNTRAFSANPLLVYARQQTKGIRVTSRICRRTGRTKAETSATAENSVRTHSPKIKEKTNRL